MVSDPWSELWVKIKPYFINTKLQLCTTEAEVQAFLTSALNENKCPVSGLGRFDPGKRVASTRYIGGWVGVGVSLNEVEKR
jgi:hypothetical protein